MGSLHLQDRRLRASTASAPSTSPRAVARLPLWPSFLRTSEQGTSGQEWLFVRKNIEGSFKAFTRGLGLIQGRF